MLMVGITLKIMSKLKNDKSQIMCLLETIIKKCNTIKIIYFLQHKLDT